MTVKYFQWAMYIDMKYNISVHQVRPVSVLLAQIGNDKEMLI